MIPDSLLSGENAAFLDAAYQDWLRDPSSVDAELAALFDGFDRPTNGHVPGVGPSFVPRSIFASGGSGGAVDAGAQSHAARRQAASAQMINAYRVRGHFAADIDPLGRREQVEHPELSHTHYGLTDADLQAEVATPPMHGMGDTARLSAILERLRAAYTGSIGVEFMNIDDLEQKRWLQEKLELLPTLHVLDKPEQKRILRKLCDAENFERMLHTRFPGTKRFSLEGAETLIPLLDMLNTHSAAQGIKEIVIGMAHRGRLNTLVNILEKPASKVVLEFEGTPDSLLQGSGDVKYHLGYSANTTTVRGDAIHLSLTPNPSHLEAVNAIVEGRVRAKQDRAHDWDRATCMPLLIHGDAAFAGQGLVPEVLNLSELNGYRTGGTFHLVINNQIGFTTPPADARSTPYATGVARMLGIPIFHVNGEDPRAVAAVVQIAVEWRQRYHRDVVIDMYCYRKHGHNEGDEPSYTQPLMYKNIRSRPTPREVFQKALVTKGDLNEAEATAIFEESLEAMQAAAQPPEVESKPAPVEREFDMKGEDLDLALYTTNGVTTGTHGKGIHLSPVKVRWEQYRSGSIADVADTSFPIDRLRELLVQVNTLPEGLNAHVKVKRLLKQRLEMIEGERGMDWSMGEQAAFASLLDQGYPVRLSGQDSGRGTFSHRHAVITDIKTGKEHYPLAEVSDARFSVFDSSLSEASVLGFELGYSYDTPEGLIMWEAQFGDFSNGAQVIIDQFISSTEQKWNRLSGLVMLLPHGYAGQGPEHSSARLERFLIMCAEDNWQVANVTTPAQYFHMMRNQVVRSVRKPLIVMTPKGLLRHELATSTLEDFATGRFHPVLPEVDEVEDVRRVVLCSGKIYYELLKQRREQEIKDIALVRVEMLYPFPAEHIENIVRTYGEPELVWCQEEPANMGAWPVISHWFYDRFGPGSVRYVGRPAAASPATGSYPKHLQEQSAVLDEALRGVDS